MSELNLPPDRFKTERELCDTLRIAAQSTEWLVYPEQGGWDLLLVRRQAPVVQVGVQAKLIARVPLLLQACPYPGDLRAPGPHYRAILFERTVGHSANARRTHEDEIYQLAAHLRLLVLRPPEHAYQTWIHRHPASNLTRYNAQMCRHCINFRHYRRQPVRTVWLPPFIPDLPAGVRSPKTAGSWQVAAVRLELRCERRGGWVCLNDARAISKGVQGTWNPKTLLSRFYRCTGKRVPGEAQQMQWKPRPRNVASKRHPEVMAAIRKLEQ